MSPRTLAQPQKTNLITNPSLEQGNLNFTGFSIVNVGAAAVDGVNVARNTTGGTVLSDQLMPVDTAHIYTLEGWMRWIAGAVQPHTYFGLAPYDSNQQPISPGHVYGDQNTETTLAVAVAPTDTQITLTSAVNWAAGTNNYVVFAILDNGADMPNRNFLAIAISSIVGNVLHFPSAVGVTWPIGTRVRQHHSAGAAYIYSAAVNVLTPAVFTKYTGIISGQQVPYGAPGNNQWWIGTKYVKLLWLFDYPGGGGASTDVDALALYSDAGDAAFESEEFIHLLEFQFDTGTVRLSTGAQPLEWAPPINLFSNSSFEGDINADGLADDWNIYNNGPEGATADRVAASAWAQRITWTVPNTSTKGVFRLAPAGGWVLNTWYEIQILAKATGGALGQSIGFGWNNGPTNLVTLLAPVLRGDFQVYCWRIRWTGGTIDPSIFFTITPAGAAAGTVIFDESSAIAVQTWSAVGGLLEWGGVEETTDAKAQGVDVKLSGVDQTVLSVLLTSKYHGRPVKIWRAYVDRNTGLVSSAMMVFQGLQLAPYTVEEQRDKTGGTVNISTRLSGYFGVSRLKGITTNIVSHQSYYPGDTFFTNTAQLANVKIYWGTPVPQDPASHGGYGPAGQPCFPAGTPILLADGTEKAIELVKLGDHILSFDSADGSPRDGRVVGCMQHLTHDLLALTVDKKVLLVTPVHRIYVGDGEFVPAYMLRAGVPLWYWEGAFFNWKPIEKIEALPKKEIVVYNLEIEPFQTYVAGGVAVHNTKNA